MSSRVMNKKILHLLKQTSLKKAPTEKEKELLLASIVQQVIDCMTKGI